VRPDTRVDPGYAAGDTVSGAYDSMLAKVISFGPDRDAALASLDEALRETYVTGFPTNIAWLRDALAVKEVRAGRIATTLAARIPLSVRDRSAALEAAAAWILDRSAGADAWSALGPFRVAGPSTLAFHGPDWEARLICARSGGVWLLDDLPLRWTQDQSGVWTVLHGERIFRCAIAERANRLEIAGDGDRSSVSFGPKAPERVDALRRAGNGRITAPLTGRVLHVAAASGDRVGDGQTLVTIEAMKMELACNANGAGTVERVLCRTGDVVESGALLVEVALD
jgi:acetyl/propionyl-CoA carboxylase alpha subunit